MMHSCRHSCAAPQAQPRAVQHSSSTSWQRCKDQHVTASFTRQPHQQTHFTPATSCGGKTIQQVCVIQSQVAARMSLQTCCCCCCDVCADPQARAWSKGWPASEPRPVHQQDVLERRLSHPSAQEPEVIAGVHGTCSLRFERFVRTAWRLVLTSVLEQARG